MFRSRIAIVPLSLLALGLGIGLGVGFMLRERMMGTPVGGGAGLNVPVGTPAWAQVPAQSSAAPRSARHTRVVDVAQQVSPAVVSIGVTKTTMVRRHDPFGFDPFLSYYSYAPRQENFPYLGSGFIIDQQGHVITNYHVVQDATEIAVTLTDERTYTARLLDADRFVDIALLRIEKKDPNEPLPTIALGNSDDIMIGETVLAIGNPFGPLIADPRPSVSTGVVSAVRRSFKANQQDGSLRSYQDMIQTDAAINPGNSGGPLVNLDGEAIGINTFIFSRSGDSASVGFSIPVNRAKRIIEEILTFGKVRAIWLDFEVRDLTPYVRQVLELELTEGAIVWSTDVNGPAQRAGLQLGDVIVAVDDKAIKTRKDLLSMLLTRTVGERLQLKVIREGEPVELTYIIDEGGGR